MQSWRETSLWRGSNIQRNKVLISVLQPFHPNPSMAALPLPALQPWGLSLSLLKRKHVISSFCLSPERMRPFTGRPDSPVLKPTVARLDFAGIFMAELHLMLAGVDNHTERLTTALNSGLRPEFCVSWASGIKEVRKQLEQRESAVLMLSGPWLVPCWEEGKEGKRQRCLCCQENKRWV